jgi:soluble epoxide hydrolase/lipid-phosphate phosphatase
LIQILEQCNVKLDEGEKVHVVSHDFGSILAGSLLGYFPHIALTASFLAVPYMPPGQKQDLDMIKKISEDILGYEFLGYQRFFMRDDSWKVIGEHKESFFALVYGPDEYLTTDFFPAGKLEEWLKADRKLPLQGWVTTEYKETRDRIFSREDAYKGPTDWYRARFRDFLGIEEESKDCESSITCPVLSLHSKEPNALIDRALKGMKMLIKDLRYKELSVKGHFVQLEAPDEVNMSLEEFFTECSGNASELSR